MNSDATEAALGLLGLSPLNAPQSHSHPHPQPHPHQHVVDTHGPSLTSTSVGIAVDRASVPPIFQSALPPSLVPLKRKQPSPALPTPSTTPLSPNILQDGPSTKPRQTSHPLATSLAPPVSTKPVTVPSQRQPQQRPFSPIHSVSFPPQTPPISQPSLPSPSTSRHTHTHSDAPPPPDSDAISCICGFTYDDGFSIACDDCSRWCHAACFGIVQGGEVPEFWKCWVCDPALEVDKERAIKIQKGRLKAMRLKASHGVNVTVSGSALNGIGGNSAADEAIGMGKSVSRRKTSPGAERKSRRGSAVAAAIEGSASSKKKRRASMLSPADPSSPSIPHSSAQPHTGSSRISYPNGNSPNTPTAVPPTSVNFPPDIYPNPSIYAQLLRVAKAWRGVTALNPPSPLTHPPPKIYSDGGYARVDSQGYRDRFGYSLSPLDNATPVMLEESVGDMYVPRTVLRTDPPMSYSNFGLPLPSKTCTSAHLRPPSPKLCVASDSSSFSHTSIYPSPPTSNYISTSAPSSVHPRPHIKSPLTPSPNTISSSNLNHTIPATTLLAPYTATIVPSAAYLADPLNGYAHLGMGKPQVRLVGGGWGVGLDARGIGGVPDPPDSEKASSSGEDTEDGKAKWARCGCWPNAVVRPVICNGSKRGGGRGGTRMRHKAECAKARSGGGVSRQTNGRSVPPPVSRMQEQQVDESSDRDDVPSASDSDADPTALSFALFALRDLRADEEIVLGWEWDDGHAVHMLPALMESPGMFAPAHLQHLRAQFTSILHALSSTFTTCACGSSTRDCAVRVMENVVEGRWPWPGGGMMPEGSEDDSSDVDAASGEYDDDVEVDVEGDGKGDPQFTQNLGLGMNIDIGMDTNGLVEVDGRTEPIKKRKVQKKNKLENSTSSVLKPNVKKAIDLGPLVGVKRGFRTREKVPLSGGWGGVEIMPSSLGPFPEVTVDGSDPGGKGKEKVQAVDVDEDDVDDLSTLPPRMRKAWHQPLPELIPEDPRDHSKRAESWRAHERWRSPSAESSISVSGGDEGRKEDIIKPELVSGDGEDDLDGQETEFDTETETDGSDDTRQMPPPPMPASLDPTTVSSLAHAVRSSSPRGAIQWDKDNNTATWIPPRTPVPASVPSGRSSQPPAQTTAPTLTPHSPTPTSLSPQTQTDPPSQSCSSISNQSLPLPVIPAISPTATFSKLSLHSPDTLFAPNLSASSSPSDPASLLTTRCPDTRPPSPIPYRPSKPLHVHPQNESPSIVASLSAPVVTLNSPDGMRDTPAEAQYQQSYRSSPELPQQTEAVPEKRPENGEDHHRVRFASPETLYGLPHLRGEVTTQNGLEAMASEDGSSDGSKASGLVSDREGIASEQDTMDVDVDVVGDHSKHNSANLKYGLSGEHLAEQSLPQEPSELSAIPPSDLIVTSGNADENRDWKETENEQTIQADTMSVDAESIPPIRELSPPPPPKVKMSLKDFALRKKKQREEEMAAKALRSPDGPGMPSSPNLDVSPDLASDSAGIIEGHQAETSGVTREESMDTSTTTEEKATAENHKLSTNTQSLLSSLPTWDQMQQRKDSNLLTAFTAKMEATDTVLLTDVDDRTPDVVSFAPEPPPPPLTTKQTSENMIVDCAPTTNASSGPSPMPAVISTSTSMSTSTSTSAANSRSGSVGIITCASNLNPPASSVSSSRRPSHEDGEITSSTPPKAYLPRSHTPPTQPRSFHSAHPPSPNLGPTSSSSIPVSRRPVPPLSRSPLSNANCPPPISSRPLPSGPRALRGSTTLSAHAPPYPPSRPPYVGSQYIPRGPSADRDRIDWDRDRQWAPQPRSRGRAGSNSWGR